VIEYDPVKSARNKRLRGFGFDAAGFLFDGLFMEEVDGRRDYGETRFIATGPLPGLGDRLFVVVYSWRDGRRRIISFRKAMTEKPEDTVIVTREMAEAALAEMMTPEALARIDAITDEDIAAQIAADPDVAPELDDAWFERAQLVIPLRDRRALTPVAVRFDHDQMWVQIEDGRTLGIPLAWFPRLLHGTPEQREAVELSRSGLHWEELDEDISIAGLLAGRGDQTRGRRAAA